MRPNGVRLALLYPLAVVAVVGCESPGARFLNFITLQKNPLVLALVTENRATSDGPLRVLDPFGPYGPLQSAMAHELHRTVALDLCFPLQLQPCLETGLYHAAVVSPIQYARLSDPQCFPVIAVPADEGGPISRAALLVVPADSPVESVDELRGKTVAFGPAGDSRTHYAALELLAEHGLQKTDLSLELLPIPGSLKHLPGTREVVASVINGSSAAGFVDEGQWQELPECSGPEDGVARDKLRVIARTAALPDSLVIASPKLDSQTFARTQAFLINADNTHPEALRPLHIQRYEVPSDELLTACRSLAHSGATRPSPAPDAVPPAAACVPNR
jgi:ABC-type phosphate/phosphonate transport system substrate-binding protein